MTPYEPTSSPWEIDAEAFPVDRPLEDKLRFLLGYAALAPSSHNSEPWKFAVEGNRVRLFADTSRWLKVADADKRELYVSLGCALENLLVAAEHFGLGHTTRYMPESSDETLAAVVEFSASGESSDVRSAEHFEAIKVRQTNHQPYDRTPVTDEEVVALAACVAEDDVELRLFADEAKRQRIEELTLRADALQFADPEWRRELGHWIGEGAFGNSWLMAKISKFAVTYLDMGKGTAKTDARAFESAPIFAFICSNDHDRRAQIRCGQVFERIWLEAAALGLAMQPMNQVLQLPELKEELISSLEFTDQVPQVAFRLGHAEREEKRSPRRPVSEVLIASNQ
ncbi:Acg family FMN-binding oxidoreductase [Persicimonas caeni]|nr:nitroreductase family protein [Persicimonas caeni]